MRIELTGTVTAVLNVDPAEFAGLDKHQALSELHKMARAEHPGANFFADELAAAALEVVDGRG